MRTQNKWSVGVILLVCACGVAPRVPFARAFRRPAFSRCMIKLRSGVMGDVAESLIGSHPLVLTCQVRYPDCKRRAAQYIESHKIPTRPRPRQPTSLVESTAGSFVYCRSSSGRCSG